ncbi:hypothetical protein EJ06DRAFT_534264 [Trichodelitschia bisporula]|uniref:Putative transcription factor kapC n=1 Tax=Trichodelitschia bisporula TaxID=703511 RepID=A0A6G1HJE3_9PEZI|nr:hypothetical protein EJ06DRAFT_534264 [Trichodelitschia bisporula]
MSLRDHLQAIQAGQPSPSASISPTAHDMHHSPPTHHDHQIDPAIAGGGYQMGVTDSGMEDHTPESRKGRRELSTSKRAAQNRAAQRAFRQRKEQYIQSLKDQVKEYQVLLNNYETIQKENYQLREYIITLQGRLLESHTELPPPPESIDLSRPPNAHQQPAPPAQMTSNDVNQLQAVAAAAAAEKATDVMPGLQAAALYAGSKSETDSTSIPYPPFPSSRVLTS